MDELREILYSHKPYIFYVTEGFYKEVGKKKPLLFVWLGDKKTNTICITNEKEYKYYFKKFSKKYDVKEFPYILFFITDQSTSITIYNILRFNADNSLKLILNALDNQPFSLTL